MEFNQTKYYFVNENFNVGSLVLIDVCINLRGNEICLRRIWVFVGEVCNYFFLR